MLAVRHAVRAWHSRHGEPPVVAVGLSGGADSTALTAAALAEGIVVHALVVDHGLQPGSGPVAARAAAVATRLGAASARVLAAAVGRDGGMEAAARAARYGALREAARWPVLLGHTLDDQAETVLLGLARGSGGRSIHGMRAWDPPWGRPLLGVRRATTRQLCTDLGVEVYDDPHNAAPEFTRVRLRHEVLPLLDEVLGGGVVAALGRTAEQLRDDDDLLDVLAADLLVRAYVGDLPGAGRAADLEVGGSAAAEDGGVPTAGVNGAVSATGVGGVVRVGAQAPALAVELDTAVLAAAPPALRRRAVRSWLLEAGVTAVTATHLYAIDELVVRWRGQGGVAVGGGSPGVRLVASRRRGRLSIDRG